MLTTTIKIQTSDGKASQCYFTRAYVKYSASVSTICILEMLSNTPVIQTPNVLLRKLRSVQTLLQKLHYGDRKQTVPLYITNRDYF